MDTECSFGRNGALLEFRNSGSRMFWNLCGLLILQTPCDPVSCEEHFVSQNESVYRYTGAAFAAPLDAFRDMKGTAGVPEGPPIFR